MEKRFRSNALEGNNPQKLYYFCTIYGHFQQQISFR